MDHPLANETPEFKDEYVIGVLTLLKMIGHDIWHDKNTKDFCSQFLDKTNNDSNYDQQELVNILDKNGMKECQDALTEKFKERKKYAAVCFLCDFARLAGLPFEAEQLQKTIKMVREDHLQFLDEPTWNNTVELVSQIADGFKDQEKGDGDEDYLKLYKDYYLSNLPSVFHGINTKGEYICLSICKMDNQHFIVKPFTLLDEFPTVNEAIRPTQLWMRRLNSCSDNNPFFIGVFTVTEGQYHYLQRDDSNKHPKYNPKTEISWSAVSAFCTQLNEFCKSELPNGYHFALPTVKQWEYACGNCFANNNNIDWWGGDMGWFKNNSNARVHDVGRKKPNEFGLYDMLGNVWEMCQNKEDTENIYILGLAYDCNFAKEKSIIKNKKDIIGNDKSIGFRLVLSTGE